jgi:hypothetical protein
MSKWFNNHDPKTEALIAQIKKRAENLYLTRQMLCAEAVVVTLNKALNGGLSEAQAVAVAAPFSIALGDSGCICGALSGAVLACGLFVGKDQPYLTANACERVPGNCMMRLKTPTAQPAAGYSLKVSAMIKRLTSRSVRI